MFLQLSVILFTGGCLPLVSGWGVSVSGPGGVPPGQTPPPSTTGYGQQAGDTHPTGMHSCFRYYLHLA